MRHIKPPCFHPQGMGHSALKAQIYEGPRPLKIGCSLVNKEEDLIRNGQGPQAQSLLLIGSGRLARHLSFYLQLSKTPFHTWSRDGQSIEDLNRLLADVSCVALAISDDALGPFIEQNLKTFTGKILHFSGSWHRDGLLSAHPLMSFGPDLYAADFYPRIHFSLTGFASLREVFPDWSNPFTQISAEQKPLYHALCVLGGNFPVLLWNKMETDLKAMGLPEESTRLYIQRVSENYLKMGPRALTGPLVRKDESTIQKNLAALSLDPWEKVYRAFREATDEHS